MLELPGAYVNELLELAGRWNVRPAEILKGLPVTHAQLADPATRVPLRVCEAIVARAHELTHEPALALHVGTQLRLSSHGFLGFAAMTAKNVGEALELACRFAQTRTSAIGLSLYVEGDTASLVIEETIPLDGIREFVILALIVGIEQYGRALTGRMLEGIGECAFPEPAFLRGLPHRELLRFERPNHRLVFPARELDIPLVSADPVATRLAREQCERELAALVDAGLPGRVRAALARCSGVAAEPPGSMTRGNPATPSLTAIARELRMSPRTLKRKLAEHGTTFTAIRDEQRRQRALLLLDNRGLSIGEIATKLGYSELPNFTRAFRKWTGVTPIAYRERAR